MISKFVIDKAKTKRIVYKYRSCSDRNIGMIASHEIWASTFKDLDDNVFEGKINDALVKQLEVIAQIPGAPVDDVKSKWLDLRKYVDNAGIYSLSQSKQGFADNAKMWSEYADSNKGFCLGFDLDMLLDSEELPFNLEEVKVNYSETVPEVSLSDLNDYTRIYTKMLGTKHTRWDYQNEIRVVYDKPGKHRYNPYALKEVYFGVMTSEENKQKILKALKGCELDVYQMHPKSGSYELEAKLVKHIDRDIPILLDSETYEILARRDFRIAETYDVLYKAEDNSKEAIRTFVRMFEQQYGVKRMNINLFNSMDVIPVLGKYPLTGKEEALYDRCLIAAKYIDSDEVFFTH